MTDLSRYKRTPAAAAFLWLSLVTVGAQELGARDVSPAVVEREPFAGRVGFVATPVRKPPIRARRVGGAGEDVHALGQYAVGEVEGLTVADIGAGTGRHVIGLSQRIGAGGRLYATEVSAERSAELLAIAGEAQLENTTVVLASRDDVGLEEDTVDVALLSDVYQFVQLSDGRRGQDRYGFLTSLRRALAPGGEVIVTYVTSSELRKASTRRALLENTLQDFTAYGFEAGRRWILDGPHWPLLVLEFRLPADGPVSPGTYMGREIATTMHWQGADWLLRAEREREEASALMIEALGVQPGWTLADFGCGNGYHTLELARLVSSGDGAGQVFGVDIQSEMLNMLATRAAEAGLANVVPLLGTALEAPLPPSSCDLVLLADVYHELSHPVPILACIRRALKPGGRLALLEFRAEDPEVPILAPHKMSREQLVAELSANGFRVSASFDDLPWQHLLFFEAGH